MADPATRPYRIELPNLIDDSDLSVYAFRLYAHIKRVAGPGGTCYEGTRKLAEKCKMSAGQVSKAKKELLDKGLVTKGSRATNGGETDELKPVDMWQQNYEAYASQGVHTVNTLEDEQPKGVHTVNEGVHCMNEGVHTVNERKNLEERTNKNIRAPRKSADAPAPEKPKERTPHQAVMDAYQGALGYPIRDGAKEGGAAKWLVNNNYTPDQVAACYRSLAADPWWEGKHISLQTVASKIGAFVKAKQKTSTANPIYETIRASDKPKKQIADAETRQRILGKRYDTPS